MNLYIYDIETYPNIFTCAIEHVGSGGRWMFEVSDRRDDTDAFVSFIHKIKELNAFMVGFNNLGFDYPVIHAILTRQCITVNDIYNKAMSLIKGGNFRDLIWPDNRIIPQIDLYKIHHFDNNARATSLKALEFAMRMDSVEDLPFPVGIDLDDVQKDVLISYNWHDIDATKDFLKHSMPKIEFRNHLGDKYDHDFSNHNDTKIGKDYFVMQLEKQGVECFTRINGKRQPRQTLRSTITLEDVVFDYIKFQQPEFNRILEYFKSKTITETKGVFKDLTATIDGLDYVFGIGGLHASVEKQLVVSDENYTIIDVDVISYYPSLAIKNKMYPEHLGEQFCDIYQDVFQQRKSYAKGTPINEMLKLALNGVYGDSGNKYSPFFDLKFLASTCVNGQLSLCMLAEALLEIPELQIIQCNTDGITYRCPSQSIELSRTIYHQWEQLTKLELEEAIYSRFWIRDVNNYIAEYAHDKSLKRKGAYEYERQYHQDQSSLVVAKAVEAHMVNGVDIQDFIYSHTDPFDFCLRAKVPRSNQLVMRWVDWAVDLQQQSLTRYYISTSGGNLIKIAPPRGTPGEYKRANKLTGQYFNSVMQEIGNGVWDERIHTKNQSKYDDAVETGISVGWKCCECNDMSSFNWENLNYDYYVNESQKLIIR